MKISNSVIYSTLNGELRIREDTTELQNTGVKDGYAFFDDVFINSYNDMVISVNGKQTVTLEDEETDESIISFSITSSVPNGEADFRFQELIPGNWYRLLINNSIGSTKFGIAHGKAGSDGTINFERVKIDG